MQLVVHKGDGVLKVIETKKDFVVLLGIPKKPEWHQLEFEVKK